MKRHRQFYLQASFGIAAFIEQKLGMRRGVHFRFVRVVPSYKLLTLWLSINPTYIKQLMAMTQELSLAAFLPKGNLIRCEMGGQGVIELQVPLPPHLRTSPRVDELPRLTGYKTAVGLSTENRPVVADFANPLTAHLLIAGLSGSGKTNVERLLVYLLSQQNKPDAVKFLLFDVADDGLAWDGFGDLPHLYHGVISDMKTAKEAMTWLESELVKRATERVTTPRLFACLDEVQVFAQDGDIAPALERLSKRGRKWGISLVLATQRPVKASLSTTVKANCGLRIVGRCTSPQESAWASDLPDVGAETLGGLGDMILVQPGNVHRIAAPLLTDRDLTNLPPPNGCDWVEFPKHQNPDPEFGDGQGDFTTQELILSLIGARYGKGRPWLKGVLEAETGHKPGSSRAGRLLRWGRDAHQLLGKYRYQLALTD